MGTVSKIGRGKLAKAMVLRGSKEKTVGGLTAKDLTRNKAGRIVSKKQSALAKRRYKSVLGAWTQAVSKARKALKITGFCAIKKGTPLYSKAKELYNSKCCTHVDVNPAQQMEVQMEAPAPGVGISTP